MKAFARYKLIRGVKRWYLVRSYRDDNGKPRQAHIAYLGPRPDGGMMALIARINLALENENWDAYGRAMKEIGRRKGRARRKRYSHWEPWDPDNFTPPRYRL